MSIRCCESVGCFEISGINAPDRMLAPVRGVEFGESFDSVAADQGMISTLIRLVLPERPLGTPPVITMRSPDCRPNFSFAICVAK